MKFPTIIHFNFYFSIETIIDRIIIIIIVKLKIRYISTIVLITVHDIIYNYLSFFFF